MQITECYNDVGPGWRKILEELHSKLAHTYPGYGVFQVKEKFGGLRVYLAYANRSSSESTGVQWADMERAIRAAEEQAEKTCEMCGEAGATLKTSNGWYKTLCSTCDQIRSLRNKRD